MPLDTQSLVNKTAVVTGASRGIGKGIAVELAALGVTVVLDYLEDEAGATTAVGEITAAGGRAFAVGADVRDPEAAQFLIDEAARLSGAPVQIVVNNAGVIPNSAGWEAESSATLTDAFLTNAAAAVFTSKASVKGMRERGWGRIVNISSIYGDRAAAAVLSYSMSKAALDAVTKALAFELGKDGITVNAIAPGNVDTAMTRRAGDGYISYVEGQTPLGRLGTVGEVAGAVVSLVANPFVTGATLVLDGGLSTAS
ncbi:SDR family NAD(P)-dependent oxidoreductase [Actinoplanes sp. CA-252034]|uniref:SDR family NAD(P)-dependent oxidoreductase n=1 Tax=Actinoplanes sp. CA-252034 TaxID=3239906 RepID=UPI003D96AA68